MIIIDLVVWAFMAHVKVIQGLYKTIRYVICKECIFERKILIVLGFILMLLLSRYVFLQVQYEFRLFALEVFVIGPGFYFLYIAPFWDEVVSYRKFEELLGDNMEKLEKEMKEFLPDVDEDIIFSFVESRKKEIIDDLKFEDPKDKNTKVEKEFKKLKKNKFKKVMEDWENESSNWLDNRVYNWIT